jgi:hypothetical protein
MRSKWLILSRFTEQRFQIDRSLLFRYNNNPEVLKTAREPHIVATLREAILTAERALLYALGFQFSIDHPQVFIRDTLDRFSAMPDPVGKFWTEFKGKAATVRMVPNVV